MNIQEIVNEHSRKIIKNIFSKLDDEEIYVLLELNNQLQDKINKIDKAIEILKNEDYIDNLPYIDDEVSDKRKLDYWFEVADKLDDKRLEALEILGDKDEHNK